ncbi:hypothetical protein Nepgr_018794 [Nepenthes gracilis]|uniref:Uncharacterized protein n=1 Tax=Nepenthes gracilis TaxID=150966 RepID=A0AAD3SS01_NEPGR|nr:hypothetical protein Nepgr_018794 [Nepenthes gracilis]
MPLYGYVQKVDISEDQHHVPYADVPKRGIISIDDEKHGPRAAHMPIQPITDTDRLVSLGSLNCLEEKVGSLDHHHQDGDLRPCTNIGQLRRNIANMRKHLAVPGALVVDELHIPQSNARDISSEGFRLKSVPKKTKNPKKKWFPSSSFASKPSNSHV